MNLSENTFFSVLIVSPKCNFFLFEKILTLCVYYQTQLIDLSGATVPIKTADYSLHD